jgi:hypothetical protein
MKRSAPSSRKREAYLRRLRARYGDAQTGLTAEYGKTWRCRCEQDPTLRCHAQLKDCLRAHGKLIPPRQVNQ